MAAYDAFDLQTLASAAIRIGVIGAASPSPELSSQLKQVLANALAAALVDADSPDDKDECTVIAGTALALGLTDLAAAAQACA